MRAPLSPCLTYGAFGVYRWVLASIVTFGHFGNLDYLLVTTWAVLGFFILSGYVAAYTLDNRYFHLRYGIAKYYLNRFLRVYPLYWLVCAFCYVLLLYYPLLPQAGYKGFVLPQTLEMWVKNITTINIVRPEHLSTSTVNHPLFLPIVSWTLGIEFLYWLAMPFLLRYWQIGIPAALAACAYHAWLLHNGWQRYDYIAYFSTQAAALYFLIGLGIYRLRKAWAIRIPRWLFRLCVLLFAVMACVVPFNAYIVAFGRYLTLPLSIVIILYLSTLDPRSWSPFWRRADYWLGGLSFGIYLLQIPGAILVEEWFSTLNPASPPFGIVVLLVANALALYAFVTIELPIQMLRNRVKAKSSPTDA